MIKKLLLVAVVLLSAATSFAQNRDTTLKYPITDRRGDPYSWQSRNPFDIRDTSLLKRNIEYDPVTKQYYIVEKIGNKYYRTPTSLTFEQFQRLQAKQAEAEYFRRRANAVMQLNRNVSRPKFRVFNNLFDRIMGVDSLGKVKIDIRPAGNVDIMAGYQGQNIKNPTLPERARKNGGFDFDMNANVNVNANIGEKLKLPINYNTLANFDFENQLKLDYKGMDDEIIKSIEAGNVNWQSKGTLIPSAQALFGLKTQLQFGKLWVTGVLANQKSSRQSLALQGGAATTQFQKRLDDYEENRHFLLGHYFRNNYNRAMSNLPVVNSQVQILRMEVWVTNRTGATTDARDIVALTDLGESASGQTPRNAATPLYTQLAAGGGNSPFRNPTQVTSLLLGQGLRPVEDFEKTFARKLNPNEYYFNPQVGWISLNQQLQPDEVLAVAYQYSYNGQIYQVGEFSQDIPLDTANGVQKIVFLKMLKATSHRPSLAATDPFNLWDLMMKNVYSLDVAGISPTDFKLNVLYEEPSKGLKRYLPEVDPGVEGVPLIRLVNLDRLNNRLDPMPDGVFDYVEGFTVLSQQGKVVFPLIEPFGNDLRQRAFNTFPNPGIDTQYLYYQLYDSIKAIAQTYANVNRFVMQGQVKGSGGSEIYLGAFNIPPGSVSVTAGGQILSENVDYTIDYNLGSVKIINQAILNSGVPVNVQFENNAGFGIQQRNFMGLRLDYLANNKLSLGGTIVRLGERPFFTKMNYGEDPIRNTMYGLDFSYRSGWPSLTRWLDKLPFYSTTAASNITAYGEAAYLKPGHPRQIGKGDEGLIYIDDFEGSTNSIDLRFPYVAWALASTPARFPESAANNDTTYGINRAKLAWYNIEPILQDRTSSNNPLRGNTNELSDPRTRLVNTTELFPQATPNLGQAQTVTFDLAYYPKERGPYNFDTRASEFNTADGRFVNPRAKWGGIMRNIDQTDFETGNVEYIEFWTQDPFIKTNATSGRLFINLGNISEDILKDGRRFYENGLPTPQIPAPVDSSTVWGKTPINPIQITQAFSNDPADRPYQDVGFDGLDDVDERRRRAGYLARLATTFGTNSPVYQKALNDPSNDNYVWYRDAAFGSTTGILGRYKNFNNPQGNSPVATTSSEFSPAATLYPDNEDLNRDNTLNENEEYYEYEIPLTPNMATGGYIVDKRSVPVKYANGTTGNETWYQFRIPIRDYTSKVGNIPDFKSIRFIRMYLTDFDDSVTMRFATLDLVRNQWRTFQFQLDTAGRYRPATPASLTQLNVSAVNVEENSNKQPVPYRIPPGIERVQYLSNNNINLLQNEQAMLLQVLNLRTGDQKAVFKTMNHDLRQYGRLSMFIHAESVPKMLQLTDYELTAVIRIGQDFLNNYYEIKIPLKVTRNGTTSADSIWPAENSLDFNIQDLIALKTRRNANPSWPVTTIYREQIGNKTFSIYGNPNLGEVRGFLIGLANEASDLLSAEVWVNELRLSKIDEDGGYAALGRVDIQMADLGTFSVSANTYTKGFGTLEQRANERARDNLFQFNAAMNIDAGKLLPKKLGITIPVYAGIDKTIRTPEYDPYDLDIKLKDKMNAFSARRDSIRKAAIDQTTVKTLNFTNIRLAPGGKTRLWSLSNFDVSYSYTKFEQSNPLILKNDITKHRGGLGYTYNTTPKYIEPFKGMRNKTPWLALIRDFNLNLMPSLLSFRADINRQFGEFVPRIVSDGKIDRVDTTYDKYFTFDRFYNMRWDITRSLNLDFTATNNARVDEPFGRLDTKAKKDTVRENFWKGGRNTFYTQQAIASYTLPTSKLPLIDWITGRYSYTTTYNWIGASRLAIDLGNTIENSQKNSINGEFDFTRLYQKSRWLRALDQPAQPRPPKTENKTDDKKGGTKGVKGPGNNNADPDKRNDATDNIPKREDVVKGLSGKAKKEALRKWRAQKRAARIAARQAKANRPVDMSGVARGAGKFITMVKRASVNYTENYSSRLPGYMDSTQLLGQNWSSMAPGLDYVFGKQPDTAWIYQQARKGLITRDSTFNFMFRQNFEQRLSMTAQVEPFREFTIDLNLDKSFGKDYSELFKDTTGTGNNFGHLNPLAAGSFNVSYIAFNTLFEKFKPNEVSETFKKFEAYRQDISQRVAKTNPYWVQQGSQTANGYAVGYGRYAQDVLIPAFIAAYTGKSPQKVALLKQSNPNIKSNPFSGIKPKPNWRLTYTGLTRIPALAKVFSTISITHGYTGSLGMNSYTSALLFRDPFTFNAPQFVDPISGNYVPFFLVPNITIQEGFDPLIGFDITTTSQLNLSFKYKKSRQLSLSLIDFQLAEINSTEWTVGGSWRRRGLNLPNFLERLINKGKPLENDINFRLDLSMRDDANSNSRLDQANAYSTGGQKVITIQPSIDYVLNNRVNLKIFFDQRRVTPYISTSAPVVNTRAGIQLRIALAQ